MSKPDHSRKALGRGIGALLPTRPVAPPPETVVHREDAAQNIPVDAIDSNPLQPRRTFNAEKLDELAQSIKANGIVQPLVVRKAGERFQLVAGERRLRAAKLAGLNEVPVVIREIPDGRLLEITLIENIQREDLNPIETASAFQRMTAELFLSPDEVGRRTGKDRSTVSNYTRLLQLPKDLQEMVADRRLSAGHARCLLAILNPEIQREVANKAVNQGWSVRHLERVTQKVLEGRPAKRPKEVQQDPNVKAAITEMQRVLATKVRIVENAKHAGRIEIDYYSPEDLDRIYTVIVGEQ